MTAPTSTEEEAGPQAAGEPGLRQSMLAARRSPSGAGPSPIKSGAIAAGLLAAIFVFTQLLLPGAAGSGHRGTPAAILFTGFVLGAVNALTAVGIILIYRSARIINFAQTAMGVAGSTFVFDAVQLTKLPFVIVFPIGLVLAALVGAAFEIAVVRRFFNASRLVLTVATIAAASLLAQVVPLLVRAMPFIPYNRASIGEFLGSVSVRRQLPFAGFSFHVGHLPLNFGFPEVFALEVVVIALVLVSAFLRFTRMGVAVRAMAENSERAALLGISVGTISLAVWVIAAVLSGASTVLTGAIQTPGTAAGFAPTVLLPALAAAVVARFRSVPLAVAAAIGIGVVSQATQWSLKDDLPLVNAGLFVLIAAGLLIQRGTRGRSEEGGGVAWQAVEEQRPIPKELASIGSVRATKWVLVAIGLAIVIAYPFIVSTGPVVLGGNIALISIIILSLVVLTGWSGQVSLGQFGLAAVGAVVGGALTGRYGISFWLAIFIAAGVTAGIATLIGIPALRIRGLFLAVTTFAFGLAITSVLFSARYFGWLLPKSVDRPTLFFINFDDEKSMYFLCVAALLLSIVFVANLRRTRFGRVLIAMRENEANIQAFAINLFRTKLLAFAVSGGLAGFAGAIYAHQQRGLTAQSFLAQRSIDVFLFAVLGGVSSIPGALIGSVYYNLTAFFTPTQPLFNVLLKTSGTFFVLLLMLISPGGAISLVNRVRDGVLRIIAQRRQIVVPSLFADYDPEALARRLIPLGPRSNQDGLAALPPGETFTVPSELYQGSGHRVIDRPGPAKPTAEAAAIGAASESFLPREEEEESTMGAKA